MITVKREYQGKREEGRGFYIEAVLRPTFHFGCASPLRYEVNPRVRRPANYSFETKKPCNLMIARLLVLEAGLERIQSPLIKTNYKPYIYWELQG